MGADGDGLVVDGNGVGVGVQAQGGTGVACASVGRKGVWLL